MLEKIKAYLSGCNAGHKVVIGAYVICAICFVVACIMLMWHIAHTDSEQTTTTMTQQEAETPAGVNTAAHNAGLTLGSSQSNSVAKQIEYIRTTEQVPVYVVETTGADAAAEATKATKDTKADFSIVASTDGKEYDLSELDADTKVTLNQYNVQAYKPVLRQVSYAPQEKIVGVSVAKKITKDGQYIGVGVDYDIDDKHVYAKVTYSW